MCNCEVLYFHKKAFSNGIIAATYSKGAGFMKQPVNIWIDAREFKKKGGWKLDTQFVHLMGSGYLIAADIPGVPVEDATVKIRIPQKAMYRIWVRDRNWYRPHDPGIFALLVNGSDNGKVLGAMPSDAWVWEIAGDFSLEAGEHILSLKDLTGYFGRCASVLITNDFDYTPPREIERLHKARAKCKGLDISETFGGDYDVIVAGGGPGGVPAAVACARKGIKTLLLHDRPVLGGNCSSEIRMWVRGAAGLENRETGIIQELELENIYRNPSMKYNLWDSVLYELAINEPNLTLLLNCSCLGCEMKDGQIASVTGWQLNTYLFHTVEAKIFLDCSGDSILAPLSGARYRMGREARAEFDEYAAPENADKCTMGSSVLIQARQTDHPCPFTPPSFAYCYPDDESMYLKNHDIIGTGVNFWWIELGGEDDTILDGQHINEELLRETEAYAESSVCRRKSLLHYFGETYAEENCKNCDNCLNPKKQVEAKDSLCAVIETIIAVKENFKSDHIIDVLLGKETSEVLAHRHEELEVFGSGEGEDDKMWNAVIRQALIAGYLSKDVENYGLLKVTAAGQKFLKKPVSFKIVEDTDFDEDEENEAPVRGGGSCAVDPALFSMLKDLRKKMSKKLDVPPYVIFQDPSLEAMATTYPVTLEELQNIPGVGAGKAKRYGQEFCQLIKKHCEENEIERPEDLRVRTVANKSKIKVSIIQAIDRKVALDDIALSKGLDFSELLDEVEAIVYSGTRLNIDYFLEEIMDEDHMLDIYDYFKESTTDKIDDAMDELGDDYTEDEIRLVRIKFISEMAN